MTQPPSNPQPLGYQARQPLHEGRGGRIGRFTAWAVILASLVILAGINWRQSRATTAPGAAGPSHVGSAMQLVGRYVVGCRLVLAQAGTNADASTDALLAQLDKSAASPADRLAVATVIGEIRGGKAALARLNAPTESQAAATQVDADTLRTIYTQGAAQVPTEKRTELEQRLGWFGKLALSYGAAESDPARTAVLAGARHTVFILIGAMAGGGAAMVAGMVVFVVLLIRLVDRKLVPHFRPLADGGPFLEAFAIYLGGLTIAFTVAPYLPRVLLGNMAVRLLLMMGPTVLAMLWPLLRGVPVGDWRGGLGWHGGRQGVVREMGLGLLGYVAGLPILAAGYAITYVLTLRAHAHPGHPVDQMLGRGDWQSALEVLIIAGIYAPLTEETMFRGAFFQALRSRHGWLLSAAVSSFIFAAIHPQGWTVVPVLMSVAITFAAIREWRATILSSAAAHCLHNSVLVVLMVSAMR